MFIKNPLYLDATDAQLWDQVRYWRNGELAASDWTQLPDAPADKAAWAEYRQNLRDITKAPDVHHLPEINSPAP